jgi:uncharacterized protein YdeI (YjbR/CyaY-like superfamily)
MTAPGRRPSPKSPSSTAPRTFRSAAAFRAWLAANHRTATGLVVRLYKVEFAHRGLGYSEALDQALCFGWIDGIRRGLDEVSFTIRFTPRKPRSIWSLVNVRRVEGLIAGRRMTPAGMAAFAARDPARTGIYSFETRPSTFDPASLRRLKADRAAWSYFSARPPGYRRLCCYWVMSAKRAETRERRLGQLIACSAKQTTIPQFTRG